MITNDAYVLFYVKKNLKGFFRQTTSNPENWPFRNTAWRSSARSRNNVFKLDKDDLRSSGLSITSKNPSSLRVGTHGTFGSSVKKKEQIQSMNNLDAESII